MRKTAIFKQFFHTNRFHLVFLISAFATLVIAAMTIFNMTDTVANMNSAKETLNTTEEFLINNYKYRLNASATAAQNLLTATDLEMLQIKPGAPDSKEAWLKDADFLTLRETLDEFAKDNGLEFVYYYFRIDNYAQPIIDNDPDFTDAYTPAHQLIALEPEARSAWNNKRVTVADEGYFVGPDGLITAYAPIFDAQGEVFALVGVDIKEEQIDPLRNQIVFLSERIESLGGRITILSSVLIGALFLLVIGGVMTFLNQRKNSEILKDALLQAEHASRAKSQFLANMSHEMRTPMNAIIGMTTIGKNSDDPERKEYSLTIIEEASKHLLGVINDVLDYSKIEAGKLELSNAVFDFEKMLKKVCDVVNFKAAEKQLHFNVYLDLELPRLLIGDEQHVAQVVANLLSNAIKFTPENGSITLAARLAENKEERPLIEVAVSDTGIGISDEQKARIFRSFEQADNTITKRFGGTGLGLAISKSIVEGMGGTVDFASELGKGSTFSFTVPFQTATEQAEAPNVTGADWTGFSALIAEDNPAVLACLTGVMQRLGVAYALVDDAEVALKAAATGANAGNAGVNNERYRVCFLNYALVGREATALLKKSGVATVVALLSTVELSAAEDEAKQAGADRILTLPLFPTEVFSLFQALGSEQSAAEEAAANAGPTYDFSGRRVLLADDVEINREIVVALLEPTNIEFDCAANGAIAVRMFSENPERYDLIFMDVQMPEMDGYQATRTIRALGIDKAKTIPIIAMTANVFKEDVERSLASGMNGHLGKPLDFDEVLSTLAEYL